MLAHRLNRISERHRGSRDFTLNTLRTALREILSCFPVYRTYIREGGVSDRDRQVVQRAAAQAKRRSPATTSGVFDFIRDVLLLEQPPELDDAGRHQRELFVGRVQQVTSPVMAKGIEDTAFYRYFPLVSLNEVGGELGQGAIPLEDFHKQNIERQATWPRSLLCSTTHDTKRSEDARARINVLSEIPRLWRKAVNRWARLNRRHRREASGQPAPSRNDEYLFYQALRGRVAARAAARRRVALGCGACGGLHGQGHARGEDSYQLDQSRRGLRRLPCAEFVVSTLNEAPKNRFLAEFRAFHEMVVNWGLYSALSLVLLKLTSPGVPDIYQGQELWDFSLVDPDNRRPVDFRLRRDMLAKLPRRSGPRRRFALGLGPAPG